MPQENNPKKKREQNEIPWRTIRNKVHKEPINRGNGLVDKTMLGKQLRADLEQYRDEGPGAFEMATQFDYDLGNPEIGNGRPRRRIRTIEAFNLPYAVGAGE